jgi:Ca2+-binding RTX toxin-like protein
MKRSLKSITQFSLISLIILLIGSTFSALAAANSVPISYADDITLPIDQSQFFPGICAGIQIQNVIYASESPNGNVQGSDGNDLIFGTNGNDKILGKAGDDCILGGGGDDEIMGMDGNDILDGGDGFDIIKGGIGDDTCVNGEDVSSCEF